MASGSRDTWDRGNAISGVVVGLFGTMYHVLNQSKATASRWRPPCFVDVRQNVGVLDSEVWGLSCCKERCCYPGRVGLIPAGPDQTDA